MVRDKAVRKMSVDRQTELLVRAANEIAAFDPSKASREEMAQFLAAATHTAAVGLGILTAYAALGHLVEDAS